MTSSDFDPQMDLYALLGVLPAASSDEIKVAYRRAALKAHPDKGGSHEWMIAIATAWEVLGDPVTRAAYDQARRQNCSLVVRQQWQQTAQEAHVRAAEYPRNWEAFEAWLNAATAEVQAHPVGHVLAGTVAGFVVGGAIGTLVGSAMSIGLLGGFGVGCVTGMLIGTAIGLKQPVPR